MKVLTSDLKVLLLASLALGLFGLYGCSAKESADRSEQAVVEFHRLFNASKFDLIHSNATDDFREVGPKKDYDEFMSAVRRKLGRAGNSTPENWNVFVTVKGTRVTLIYKTEFEHGTAREQFGFIDRGSGPKLLAYTINSNALVTK